MEISCTLLPMLCSSEFKPEILNVHKFQFESTPQSVMNTMSIVPPTEKQQIPEQPPITAVSRTLHGRNTRTATNNAHEINKAEMDFKRLFIFRRFSLVHHRLFLVFSFYLFLLDFNYFELSADSVLSIECGRRPKYYVFTLKESGHFRCVSICERSKRKSNVRILKSVE